MRKIFDLLDSNERRVLGLLSILVIAALLFHALFALGEKRTHSRLQNSLSAGEERLQAVISTHQEKKGEWERWKEVGQDIEQLRKNRFYKEKGNINQLRKDLDRILRKAGVRVSQISYNYNLFEEEKIKRVTMRLSRPCRIWHEARSHLKHTG